MSWTPRRPLEPIFCEKCRRVIVLITIEFREELDRLLEELDIAGLYCQACIAATFGEEELEEVN